MNPSAKVRWMRLCIATMYPAKGDAAARSAVWLPTRTFETKFSSAARVTAQSSLVLPRASLRRCAASSRWRWISSRPYTATKLSYRGISARRVPAGPSPCTPRISAARRPPRPPSPPCPRLARGARGRGRGPLPRGRRRLVRRGGLRGRARGPGVPRATAVAPGGGPLCGGGGRGRGPLGGDDPAAIRWARGRGGRARHGCRRAPRARRCPGRARASQRGWPPPAGSRGLAPASAPRRWSLLRRCGSTARGSEGPWEWAPARGDPGR
jgi:hypothetical protein